MLCLYTQALRNRKAIVIQKVWRGYSALQALKKMGKMKRPTAKPKKKRGGKKKVATKAVLPLAKVLDTIAGIYEKKVKADIIDEKKTPVSPIIQLNDFIHSESSDIVEILFNG